MNFFLAWRILQGKQHLRSAAEFVSLDRLRDYLNQTMPFSEAATEAAEKLLDYATQQGNVDPYVKIRNDDVFLPTVTERVIFRDGIV